MKISIIGFSGSGKSTLAKALSMKYNIKPLYMDTIHWLPNWVEKDFDQEKQEFDDLNRSFYERDCQIFLNMLS